MKYLDPKADLTFKKVFGEHPDLVISLLNALLPLDKPEEEVQSIEYLPAELVPDNPLRKNSIVDVRCKDARGRQFIVEMQMVWSKEFQNRVLFNASKAYVRQLDKSNDYDLLQPVYSLNLVNDIFEPDMEPYYHYYRMVRPNSSPTTTARRRCKCCGCASSPRFPSKPATSRRNCWTTRR